MAVGSVFSSLQTAGIGLAVTAFVGSELKSRFGLANVNVRSWCIRVLLRSWPETLALTMVFFFAILLRIFVNPDRGMDPTNAEQMAHWNQIKREWPILLGADTLLNLQGMIRLLIWMVVSLRLSMSSSTRLTCRKVQEITSMDVSKAWEFAPLAGSAAALSLAAALARAALAQQTSAYGYDGPLGGAVPIFVETTTVPFLTAIAMKLSGSMSAARAAGACGIAVWLSSRNYLNISGWETGGEYAYDKMFILAHCLELLASFAFLANTIRKSVRENTAGEAKKTKRSAWNGFVHLMLPVQQALASYYWLTAFEPEREPGLIGAGRPFCLLKIIGLLQLATYLCAFAFYLAECLLWNAPPEEQRAPEPQDTGNDVALANDIADTIISV